MDTLTFGIEINDYYDCMHDILIYSTLKRLNQNSVEPIEIEINDICFEVIRRALRFYSYYLKSNDFSICFAEKLPLTIRQ